MNRIWWDRRPVHLRDAAGWLDFHLPRIGRALMPIRCRECMAWGWTDHTYNCSIGRDHAARTPIFWRAMAIAAGVLLVELGVIVFVLEQLQPLSPVWWVGFAATFVFAVTGPFLGARLFLNWWLPNNEQP